MAMQDQSSTTTAASDGSFSLVLAGSFAPGSYNSEIRISDGANIKDFKKRVRVI